MSKEERERDYLPHLSDNQDMLSWLFHGLWASEERFFRAFWSKDILQSSAVSAEDIQWLRWSLPDLCAGLYLQFFLFKVACPLTYFWICIFWSSQGFFLTVHCDWLPATCFLPTPSSMFLPLKRANQMTPGVWLFILLWDQTPSQYAVGHAISTWLCCYAGQRMSKLHPLQQKKIVQNADLMLGDGNLVN